MFPMQRAGGRQVRPWSSSQRFPSAAGGTQMGGPRTRRMPRRCIRWHPRRRARKVARTTPARTRGSAAWHRRRGRRSGRSTWARLGRRSRAARRSRSERTSPRRRRCPRRRRSPARRCSPVAGRAARCRAARCTFARRRPAPRTSHPTRTRARRSARTSRTGNAQRHFAASARAVFVPLTGRLRGRLSGRQAEPRRRGRAVGRVHALRDSGRVERDRRIGCEKLAPEDLPRQALVIADPSREELGLGAAPRFVSADGRRPRSAHALELRARRSRVPGRQNEARLAGAAGGHHAAARQSRGCRNNRDRKKEPSTPAHGGYSAAQARDTGAGP